MDEAFDPYRKWLGIPPEEQPPHHYRLLGLELFEADADVIVNAADSRLTFLQSLSKDPHANMAERIAAQIKEVQVCLLDPAKKAFYDGQLQRRIAAMDRGNTAMPLAPPPQSSPMVDVNGLQLFPNAEPAITALRTSTYSKSPKPSRSKAWPKFAAVMLGLIAVGSLLVFLLQINASKSKTPGGKVTHAVPEGGKSGNANLLLATNQTKPQPDKPIEKPDDSPDDSKKITELDHNAGTTLPSMNSSGNRPLVTPNGQTENPFDREDENNPANNDDNSTSANAPEDDTSASKNDDNPPEIDIDNELPAMRQKADKRQPIPSNKELQAAEKVFREKFGKRIAESPNITRKRLLSEEIWRLGLHKGTEPATRYVMMSNACQILAGAGFLNFAMNHIDTFAQEFEVNPWDLKAQAASRATKAVSGGNSSGLSGEEIVITCRQLAEEAKLAGQIDVASKVIKDVTPLAKLNPMLFAEINPLSQKIERLKARYQPVRKAFETLENKPDDPVSNLVAGRWICFENRDWDKGLPLLSKSSEAKFANLAAKDLAAPQEADRQMEIADGWWELAQKEESNTKAGMLSRAGYWYENLLPLLSGKEKTKVETRMKTISGSDAPATATRGAVQAGNVALAKNGTRVYGIRSNADKLLDGMSENPGWDGAAANSPVPCEWTISLDKVYQLREIHFRFYSSDARFYHYAIAVSADGVTYKPLIARNQGQWFDWQTVPIPFPGMPIKSIKLYGTESYKKKVFSITEFEAHCIPPKQ